MRKSQVSKACMKTNCPCQTIRRGALLCSKLRILSSLKAIVGWKLAIWKYFLHINFMTFLGPLSFQSVFVLFLRLLFSQFCVSSLILWPSYSQVGSVKCVIFIRSKSLKIITSGWQRSFTFFPSGTFPGVCFYVTLKSDHQWSWLDRLINLPWSFFSTVISVVPSWTVYWFTEHLSIYLKIYLYVD